MGFLEVLDIVFLIYFMVHIPVAIFVDSQAILPQWIYPNWASDLVTWYCREFKDPMMVDPPAWFSSFVYCEILFQLPFFILAVYVFIKGIERFPWIQKPMIIYAAHTATTTVAITFHTFLHDFSDSKYPGPVTLNERLTLFSIYFPFLFVPLLILVTFSFRTFPMEKFKSQ